VRFEGPLIRLEESTQTHRRCRRTLPTLGLRLNHAPAGTPELASEFDEVPPDFSEVGLDFSDVARDLIDVDRDLIDLD
jgi:hypothetical protein